MKKVIIIILNWNKWQETIDCLNSVYQSDYSNFEVLLIDNASSDGSVGKIKAAFPDLRMIVNSENIGFTGGNNQGMRIAASEGADYVWLLNNDTEVEPDCLSQIVAVANSSRKIGLVSPAICYYAAPEVYQFRGSVVDWDNFEIVYMDENNNYLNFFDGDSVCLWGTALLVNVDLISNVGFLNEDYFAYYEDTDYSMRSIVCGYKNVYCINAKVLHKHDYNENQSVIRSSYYYYYMIRNEYFLWKNFIKFKFNRILFKRIAVKSISKGMKFKNMCYYEHMRACVQALFDAIFNKKGKFVVNKIFNSYLVIILLWHPYFLLNIALFDIKALKMQIRKFLLNM